MKRVLISWSSGKDSAWMLHVLRQQAGIEIVGLVTSFNQAAGRVAMHAVRRELVERQATVANLPLWSVQLPWSCPNEVYEARMREAIERARQEGITHIAFGDLFLEDIRAYRERMLAGTGVDPLFPIWMTSSDTARLAREMIAADLRAVITCVDPQQIDGRFAGREFDENLLADLPAKTDPCGERGEFHTFCWSGPMFSQPINVRVPGVSFRDGFWFADLVPRDPQTAPQALDAGPLAQPASQASD
jgi:uncharacterized protein (TIGR00290 family)